MNALASRTPYRAQAAASGVAPEARANGMATDGPGAVRAEVHARPVVPQASATRCLRYGMRWRWLPCFSAASSISSSVMTICRRRVKCAS